MRTSHVLSTAALTAALAVPAHSAPPVQTPATQIWIDVGNHKMANMPDMGALGRFAMGMMGGNRSRPSFPTTRNLAAPGQFLDVAVHNRLKPGKQVEDEAPDGLGLGRLVLLPPSTDRSRSDNPPQDPPDVEITIREYWGCGGAIGPGQPKVSTYTVKGGQASVIGGMTPSTFAPQNDVQPTPAYALWPNTVHGQRVSEGASLVGGHRFSGEGIPASLRFDLDRSADFMPEIALTSLGEGDEPIQLSWLPVERAQAYFLQATQAEAPAQPGVNKMSMTVWSSAATAGAGAALVDYVGPSHVQRWLKEKVLLPTGTTSCTVPQGIFATGKGAPGMTLLNMIAYGPETHLAHPAKPTDPKLLAAWKPEWSVRVRTKSTASLVLGMEVADARQQDGKKESVGKKLLRGLLRTR